MKNCGAYAIVNRVTGMRYVGQSIDIDRRIAQHFASLRRGRNPCRTLQAAFGKDGEGALFGEVLELCDRSALDVVEQKHIDAGVLAGNLYNNAKVAGWPAADFQWSEDDKRNWSERRRAAMATPQWRATFKSAMARRSENVGWRAGAAARGRIWRQNADFVSRHDAAMAARSADPQWQASMVERNKAMTQRVDWKAATAAGHATPEAKANHGAATRRFWEKLRADPIAYAEFRERQRAGMAARRAT